MKNFYFLVMLMLSITSTSPLLSQVIDIIGTGFHNSNTANILINDPGTVDQIVMGTVFKSPDAALGQVRFSDINESEDASWVQVPVYLGVGFNPNIGSFSTTFSNADGGGINAEVLNTDDADGVYSFYAFVYSTITDPTHYSVASLGDVVAYHNGSANPHEYNVTIGTSSAPRDIVVKVPLTELSWDDRMVIIDIEAGTESLQAVETKWDINLGESFFIGTYTLPNVPGDVTNVKVSIHSPNPTVDFDEEGIGLDGDSFFGCGVVVDVYDECGECDGQITDLKLQYLGTETGTITVEQKSGKNWVNIYTGPANDQPFSFQGVANHDKMGAKIFLYINGENKTEIHTSCSQDIYAGQTWGDYYIVSGESHEGGPLCYIPGGEDEEECDACDGQITQLELEYLGTESGEITVFQKNKKDWVEIYKGTPIPGETFSFSGVKKHNKMGAKIFLYVDDENKTEIHTSCSQDIYAGQIWGDYYIESGESHEGGPLCEYDPDKSAVVKIDNEPAGLLVYPNPVSHYGNIDFIASQDGSTTVEIYNLVGARIDVLFNDFVKAGSKTSLTFNANKYPKGMFILYIRNGSNVHKEKITIVH